MSLLSTLMGTPDTKMTEKDIAIDMLNDSKSSITYLSSITTESINPKLRNILMTRLENAVQEHFELTDIIMKKGWYPASDNPQQQLVKDYAEAKQLTQDSQ